LVLFLINETNSFDPLGITKSINLSDPK
jgi:hypothetical protein